MNSTKVASQHSVSTSACLVPQGTLVRDVNNTLWMVHQCVKVSRRSERFIYQCSQVKRSTTHNEPKTSEENIVKTKISPLMFLTEKLKESRQAVLDKARADNDQLDYIFYGAVLGETNKEIELILPSQSQST
jgi:hypothetical protein